MKLSRQITALTIILLLPVMARADWERSISAWDTRLPNKGKIQTSFWGNSSKSEIGNLDLTDTGGMLEVAYGISDKWTAYIAPSFDSWDLEGGGAESGLSDTTLQTTYRFRDEAVNNFDLAVTGDLSIPTGNDNKTLGTGNYEPGAKLFASKKFGSVIAVANLSLKTILGADSGEKSYILGAVAEGVYPLNDKLSLNAAVSASTARTDGADSLLDLGLGARYNVKDNMFVGGMLYKCLTDAYDLGIQVAAGIQF